MAWPAEFTPPPASGPFPEGTEFFDIFDEGVPGLAVPFGDDGIAGVSYESPAAPERLNLNLLLRSTDISESDFLNLVS